MPTPTCVTKSPAVDKQTTCMQRTPVPGPKGVNLVSKKENQATSYELEKKQHLGQNPPHVNNYFDLMYLHIHALAQRMKIDEDLLFALSSKESGWLDSHNQGLHNPWGFTQAGGNNLSFSTYDEAVDYFESSSQWGTRLKNKHDINSFTAELDTKPKYNSVKKGYTAEVKEQYYTVIKRKRIWQLQKGQ